MISSRPAIAPAPGRSPSAATPSATATTGATYVITAARPGPTSVTRVPKSTNAAAVQRTPSTINETIASADTAPGGGAAIAAGVSATEAIASAPAIVARGSTSARRSFSSIGPIA